VSRSADNTRRDAGFTLVEIIVALGILMVVATALLPQLVVGIRSTGIARTVSQAKGVAQGQLDRMRNLPFHVSPAAGDYRDVLDFYYRNLTAGTTANCPSSGPDVVPQTSWSGYVASGVSRCRYEPASGVFYRKVEVVPASAGNSGFVLVVDTQFLSGATPPAPVTPPPGYDTQTTGKDTPSSSQIGITVTVVYSSRGPAEQHDPAPGRGRLHDSRGRIRDLRERAGVLLGRTAQAGRLADLREQPERQPERKHRGPGDR